MRKLFMILPCCIGLAACDIPTLPSLAMKPVSYHTVSYYDANPAQRDAANNWCHDNAGLADKNPSCANADLAGIHDFNQRMGFK